MKRIALILVIVFASTGIIFGMGNKNVLPKRGATQDTRILELQLENKKDVALLQGLEQARQQANVRIIGRNAIISELQRQKVQPKKKVQPKAPKKK